MKHGDAKPLTRSGASTDAVCPTCLAKSACLNHAWSHSLVSACPEHESALIDTCPSCCETLSPTRFDLATCDCGYALTEAAAKRATPFEIWVSARLAGDMRSIDGLPEIGSPADYKGLARLLFSLAMRLDPRAKGKPAKVSRPHDLGHTQALLASIWPLFAQWPHGFNAHVRARLAAGNRKSFSPSGRLGGWYTTLLALTAKAGAFGPVWVSFSDAMIEHFDGNLRGQQLLTPSPGRLRRYLSMKEAAQLIGVTQPFLLAAIEKGSVQGHVTIRGVAYTQAMMVRDEADRIKAARAEWTSEPHASDIFGVPVSVIRGLCKAGVIEAKPDWQTDILRASPIRTASLGTLVRKLAGLTENRRENDILTFAQLTAKRTTDVSALTKLYKAIEAGEVRPVAYDVEHSLGGFIFAASEIRAYVGSAALAEGMTLAQLEKAAGWKYDAISNWCTEGFLEVSEVILHGRAARLITNTALAAFRRDWIPISDLAKSLGTPEFDS